MSTIAQRSFAGGEIAPALYARVDTSKYATGLRTCRNFFVMRHGGAQNRTGSSFVGEVKDSSKTVRLIPFIFNSSQTYVLEFGDEYMRVIRNGEYQTLTAQNITAITNANPCVLTYSGSDTYANGDEVYISGIVGAIGTYLNGRNFKVASVNTGTNTFALDYMDGTDVDSTSMGAYTSGGTVAEVYTLTSPYDYLDLPDLQYVQSADVITLVHPSYAPRELTRSGHTSWAFATITFAPETSAPTNCQAVQGGATGTTTYSFVVTAVASETLEESLASTADTITDGNATISASNYIDITWNAVSGAQEYNVYQSVNGIYGFIGVAGSTSFRHVGTAPDTTETPPTARNPFGSTDNYPSAVTYYQERLCFANTNNDPEKVWTSRSAQYKNFTVSSPLQDDDAVTFTITGRQVNEVRHLLDLGTLLLLTSGGEHVAQGDSAGVLKPTDINRKQQSYNGSSTLPPLIIGGNALYVQARGAIVRDLAFEFQSDGYRGNDLTIYSSHFFDQYTLTDWTYQQIPQSIIWAVRSDGTLLGLTYVREQQLIAWHRHDTDGTFENVCSVPEGNEDFLYVVVNRTIDGDTKRYIERFNTRLIEEVEDSIFMDAAFTYDGRNSAATTMTLSGGTTWVYTETLTLTASAATFASTDVGNSVHLTGSDGTVIRFEIVTYSSTTVVTGKPHMTVPVSMRSVATTDWALAVDSVTGLWHLEGEEVSVFADGFVVANPNNEAYDVVTVTNGTATLDRPYAVIHIGLPYFSDLETLDIDTDQGETLVDKKKIISKVTLNVESSRGIWIGSTPPTDDDDDPLEGLQEYKTRNDEPYNDPVELETGPIEVNIRPEWSSNGRVFVRQTDPIPLSVLAIAPAGLAPFRR